MNEDFSYSYFAQLKKQSCAIRLLSAEHFPLLASFFYLIFIANNRRAIAYIELIGLLERHLADINQQQSKPPYPKTAKAYVDDWINHSNGYLRKYLPQDGDEPECDLLPEVEKALRWLEDLHGRQFVGTGSRLKLVLELIQELVHGTSDDKQARLMRLQQKKAEIEQQIAAVTADHDSGFDNTQITEKMYLLSDMSRQLLGDFRQVEANFRSLDKDTRKTIALGGRFKGKVLDQVFGDQDVIDGSDEGKSFSAFFELLMSPNMRQTMREDLKLLLNQKHARQLSRQDEMLVHLYSYLLDAGHKVNYTRMQINDQLRRYIQEQSQDDRRILQLIGDFEAAAHQVELDSKSALLALDGFQAEIGQQFSRQLYQSREKEQLDSQIDEAQTPQNIDMSDLFEVSHIDEAQLKRNIDSCLIKYAGQASLAKIIAHHPLEQGLDEVLCYLKLACEDPDNAHIDPGQQQTVQWQPQQGLIRTLSIPHITYTRGT